MPNERPVERPVGPLLPEREAFEAWAMRDGWGGADLEKLLPNEYRSEWVQAAWRVWQAALAPHWRPIADAAPERLALLYAPPEALYEEPAGKGGEYRVAAPRNWTWATHWLPLPERPNV